VRALMQSPTGAQLVGINTRRLHPLMFGIGLGLSGVAGALLSMTYEISPSMGEPYTVTALIVITLGGFGSIARRLAAACCWAWWKRSGMHFTSPSLKMPAVLRRVHRRADLAAQRTVLQKMISLFQNKPWWVLCIGLALTDRSCRGWPASSRPLGQRVLVSLRSCDVSRWPRAGRCSAAPRATSRWPPRPSSAWVRTPASAWRSTCCRARWSC
jgi:hypothetical protein